MPKYYCIYEIDSGNESLNKHFEKDVKMFGTRLQKYEISNICAILVKVDVKAASVPTKF